MPIVTSISPQKNKKRINVYLDGKFGFGIDLTNFVLFGLKVKQEIADERIGEIVKKAEFQKTYDKLLKFATLRPRSEKEIEAWMNKKDVHESLREKLNKKLKHLDLLDDEKFSEWWIGQRLEFKSKSRKDLEYELKVKGIKNEIIKNVFQEIKIDENKIALVLLKKKMSRWQNYGEREKRQKMLQYLSGKGFAWEVVKKTVEKLIDETS